MTILTKANFLQWMFRGEMKGKTVIACSCPAKAESGKVF
jgi:hypothetical protein